MNNEILTTQELITINRKADSTVYSMIDGTYKEEIEQQIRTLAQKIYDIASETIKHLYTVCIVDENLMQFIAFEGKNGCGDFLYDDMQNVFECLKKIRKLQDVESVWVQEMSRDTCDDVSAWNICIQY